MGVVAHGSGAGELRWHRHGVAAGGEARLCGGGGELGGTRVRERVSFGMAWRLGNGDVGVMR